MAGPPPCAVLAGKPASCTRVSPLAELRRRFDAEARQGVCETGRYRMRYFSWGEGPPLVFVPGLSGTGLGFVAVSAHLCRHFRCVSYDFPSGGPDGARLRGLRHADFVADLLALLDHLGIGASYVAGFSFGSTVALAALREQPARLRRGLLIAGFARRRLAPAELAVARLGRYWSRPMRRLPGFPRWLVRCHAAPFRHRPIDYWENFIELCGTPPLSAVLQRTLLMHRYDATGFLPQVRQPILLVQGEIDPLVSARHVEELRRGLPNCGQVTIAGCGHYPLFTHPETLAEIVAEFLTPPR